MLYYAATIFLSAFLLFLVQPLIGKFILPWFGGGSGVWTVCLLFFQGLLLAGYAYAHGIVRWLSPRGQMWLHIALLALALAFLPIVPGEQWKPHDASIPAWRILLLLTVCLAGPYLMLAATGPLLQAWFARTHAGASPYRLYALSNAGSLLALMAYPFAVEPLLSRSMQAILWSGAFVVFALLCGYCAVRSGGTAASVTTEKRGADRSSSRPLHKDSVSTDAQASNNRITLFLWVLLPACASIMLLGVTSQITQDVAPVPLLWILPLAIYLLSFIICFEWSGLYHRTAFGFLFVVSVWLVPVMMLSLTAPIQWQIAGHLFILLIVCMVCHGEVYRLRPPASRLTGYYLCIATGGALGGAFVSLVAPAVFSTYVEYYIGLFGTGALLLTCMFTDASSVFHRGAWRPAWLGLILVVIGAGFVIRMIIDQAHRDTVYTARNFYGVLSVDLRGRDIPELEMWTLEHSRITHGLQLTHPDRRWWPTTYYGPETGAGRVLRFFPKPGNHRVGLVGLGVGTLAVFGKPGDVYRCYEINPEVIRLAQNHFTFLEDSRATIEMAPAGDARLMLEREEPQRFDVLVLDAFSGDAIPVHLLTKEAFEIYMRHMNEDGAILVHITNQFVDLLPVLTSAAEHFGLEILHLYTPADEGHMVWASRWVILTSNEQLLRMPEVTYGATVPGPTMRRVRLWTDDRSNLLDVLR